MMPLKPGPLFTSALFQSNRCLVMQNGLGLGFPSTSGPPANMIFRSSSCLVHFSLATATFMLGGQRDNYSVCIFIWFQWKSTSPSTRTRAPSLFFCLDPDTSLKHWLGSLQPSISGLVLPDRALGHNINEIPHVFYIWHRLPKKLDGLPICCVGLGFLHPTFHSSSIGVRVSRAAG